MADLEMFRGGLEAEIEIWAWSRFTPFPGSLPFPGRRMEKRRRRISKRRLAEEVPTIYAGYLFCYSISQENRIYLQRVQITKGKAIPVVDSLIDLPPPANNHPVLAPKILP